MFCFSLKSVPLRMSMIVFGIVIAMLCALLVNTNIPYLPTQAGVYMPATSHEDRVSFLKQFGWNVQDNPISVEEIFIPTQFGDVYSNYNSIQLAQGFDLLPYAGKSVKKWVYAVTNYPGYAQSEVYVRATILVCGERIIGGDICSVELDGFMHGFAYQLTTGDNDGIDPN